MTKGKSYTISVLKDYSRLNEVWRLAYETLLEAGDILPREDGLLKIYPHLDEIPETTILVAEQDGKIVGTASTTVDNVFGLHTDKWFKAETDEIRKQNASSVLCSSWRIATDISFRNSKRLVLDLIGSTFEILFKEGCDTCLLVFNARHVKVYQRIIGAEVVATKRVSIENGADLDVALMRVDVKKGWEIFK